MITLLLADDDPDDRLLVGDALEEGGCSSFELRCVSDGEELVGYLRRLGPYADPAASPRPSLILLDLKMPRKDGHQALREIKGDPLLRRIPVVVLTTSGAEEDVSGAYDSGANSFVVKPTDFGTLVEVMRTMERYWGKVVTLPPGKNEGA